MNKSAGRMGMKTFAGNRPTADIIRDARAQGVKVFAEHYDRDGDHITFESHVWSAFVRITYSAFNGRFFGEYHSIDKNGVYRKRMIDSSSTKYEKTEWFQGLLSFFYAEKKESHFKPPVWWRPATTGPILRRGVVDEGPIRTSRGLR